MPRSGRRHEAPRKPVDMENIARVMKAIGAKALASVGPSWRGRVRANPAQLAALELHVTAICDLASQGANAAWEIGAHYNELVSGRLSSLAGKGDTRMYLAKRLAGRFDASMVQLFGAVQREFPKEAVERFGPSRLYRLMTYLRRTDAEFPETVEELEKVTVDVPDGRGRVCPTPFPNCSQRELDRANRRLVVAWIWENNERCRVVERAIKHIREATNGAGVASLVPHGSEPWLRIEPFATEDFERIAKALLAAVADADSAPSAKSRHRATRSS